MHKKLAADLTSLAHSILQMKNKEDVFALKTKAHHLYEKLSVLAYVEEYINNTPNPTKTKEALIAEIEAAETLKEPTQNLVNTLQPKQAEAQSTDKEVGIELFDVDTNTTNTAKAKEEPTETLRQTMDNAASLQEELKGTLAVDVAADLFVAPQKKSLNDALLNDIQIGLNDRIAFVKNLFDDSQEDFNRVVSQLNTFKTLAEAQKFISQVVKPDYNWTDKEEFEERFIALIERKFG